MRDREPDVVLLDLGLPDVDALTVLGRVRATCDAPVVAMTLAEDDDGISGALEAGADDYLAKPFDVNQLLARLRAVLWRASGAQAGAPPLFESNGLYVDFGAAEVAVGRAAGGVERLGVSPAALSCPQPGPGVHAGSAGGGGLGARVRGRPASGAGVRAASAAEDRAPSGESAPPGYEAWGGLLCCESTPDRDSVERTRALVTGPLAGWTGRLLLLGAVVFWWGAVVVPNLGAA